MKKGTVSLVLTFPSVWPASNDFIIFEQKSSDIDIRIIANKDDH